MEQSMNGVLTLSMWSGNNMKAGKGAESLSNALMMLIFNRELTFVATTQ